MARTVPVYAFQAADGSTIRFAVDSDLWITNLTGDDGLDVEMTEQQSTGQTGKTITGPIRRQPQPDRDRQHPAGPGCQRGAAEAPHPPQRGRPAG